MCERDDSTSDNMGAVNNNNEIGKTQLSGYIAAAPCVIMHAYVPNALQASSGQARSVASSGGANTDCLTLLIKAATLSFSTEHTAVQHFSRLDE
mmetsp:Transcript_34285/g.45407  ORF Transcript_34285/g.45407 Transcript_34285/m.45407 type:complete len:94 (-) Transcript_34285:429-710(-)